MAGSNNGKRPPVAWVVWIVGVAMWWPALAAGLVWRRMKWRNAWVSLSVILNVFFVSMFVIVSLDERTESQRAEDRLQPLIAPDCIEFEPEALKFCRPRIGSELARIEPNTTYVAERGHPRARFGYEDENIRAITDIQVFDDVGRSCVNVNFKDGLISFDHYPNEGRSSPDLSFMDRDMDGIPDQKIDWDLAIGFERVGEIVWRPMKKKDD